jgi:hypothetical protein
MKNKSEFREPKPERNPKPEIRKSSHRPCLDLRLRASDFGVLSDFGFRISAFGSLAHHVPKLNCRRTSTGDSPAPRETEVRSELFVPCRSRSNHHPAPPGKWPAGPGGSPVLPGPTPEFGRNGGDTKRRKSDGGTPTAHWPATALGSLARRIRPGATSRVAGEWGAVD